MPPVTKTQLQTFRKIKKQFGVPRLQAAGKWRTFSNDDIWICIVSQVVVVGRAAPGGRLWEKENRRRIRWNDVVDLSTYHRLTPNKRSGKSCGTLELGSALKKGRAIVARLLR